MRIDAKLISLAAVAVSGFIAPRLAKGAWKAVTGKEPPEAQTGASFVQILAFAVVSAVAVAALDNLTAKGVARFVNKDQLTA